VEDKEEGIYLDGIYYGGMGSQDEAETITRRCVNEVKGGIIVPRSFPIDANQTLPDCIALVRRRFHDIEREMIDIEDMGDKKRK